MKLRKLIVNSLHQYLNEQQDSNNLDLYMLDDEYIRVFEPIPIKNIIKVSDIYIKNKTGGVLTTNTEKKINDIINRLKNVNVEINC